MVLFLSSGMQWSRFPSLLSENVLLTYFCFEVTTSILEPCGMEEAWQRTMRPRTFITKRLHDLFDLCSLSCLSGDAWAVVSSFRVRHCIWSTVFGSFDGTGATLTTVANVQVMKLQIKIQEIQSECSTQSSQTCQKMQRTCQLKLLKAQVPAIMWSWASPEVPVCCPRSETIAGPYIKQIKENKWNWRSGVDMTMTSSQCQSLAGVMLAIYVYLVVLLSCLPLSLLGLYWLGLDGLHGLDS